MSFEDILRAIRTDQQVTDVDVWEKLKHYFSEHWDGQPDIFRQVLFLSKRQIGDQPADITTQEYFTALQNNFSDQNDILEFLINITGYLNYHTEMGSIKMADSLKKFRQKLRDFKQLCMKRGIFRDKHFVGRDDQIKQIEKEITTGNIKGILLCGLGGMGKTCLANTVCYDLRRDNWKTTKFELREQRTFRHFLRSSLLKLNDLTGPSVGYPRISENDEESSDFGQLRMEESLMEKTLIKYIKNTKRKHIFMFDNIDDVISSQEENNKVLEFFKTLLMQWDFECKARIIVTSRENFVLTYDADLKSLMLPVEVKSLDKGSAHELVRKCISQVELSDNEINFIVNVCGACPLALRVISSMLNNAPKVLLCELEKTARSMSTSILQISHCIQQPYERLEEHKLVLCKLSLFGTAKFDLKSAAFVVFGDKYSEKVVQRDVKSILLLFKSRHLIETENFDGDEQDGNGSISESEIETSEQKIFSIHPLVYKFLMERSNDQEVIEAMKEAKHNYLVLFDKLVLEIGQAYDRDILQAREKSEKLKVHIAKYLELLKEQDNILEFTKLSDEKTRGRSNVVQLTQKPDEHLTFLKLMCLKFEENSIIKCSWEIEHVTAMIRYEMFDDDINHICDEIIDRLSILAKGNCSKDEKSILAFYRARMLYNKGLLQMEMNEWENCKTSFENAALVFKSTDMRHDIECKMYLAEIYNCIGCIHYRKRETEDSVKMHKRALQIHTANKIQNESTLTFAANIGACHFRLGIQSQRDNDKISLQREMKQALRYYGDCITVAQHLKLEMTEIYVKKLKNRGDVYYMLEEFSKAEEDYKNGLDIIQALYIKPNRKQIILRHALGDLIRIQVVKHIRGKGVFGNPENNDTDGIVQDWLENGIDIYDKLSEVLREVELPTDDDIYSKIKKNHMFFLKQMFETEKLEKTKSFYETYECGRNIGAHSPEEMSPQSVSSSNSDSTDDSNDDTINEKEVSSITQESVIRDEKELDLSDLINQTERPHTCEKKQNFKLPLPSLKSPSSLSSPSSWAPQTMISCRKSSSSSGISSIEGNDPELERKGKLMSQDRMSIESGLGETSDDDVFLRKRKSTDDRAELSDDAGWTTRRKTLNSFGSSSLDDTFDNESQPKKPKMENDNQSWQSKSLDETRTKQLKRIGKQRSEDWILTEKLSSSLMENRKDQSSQTEGHTKDYLLDELVTLMPDIMIQPRVKKLFKELETGKAHLVDDTKGRPTVQYDEDNLE